MTHAQVPSVRMPKSSLRRRSILAALGGTAMAAGAVSGCTVPAPQRPVSAADPAPGMPIASSRRAQLMQIVAHPDDDLYFMNPDTERMLESGVPLVSIYVSAGEHTGINKIPGRHHHGPEDRAGYSSARHQGLRQAYAAMIGLDKFSDWTKGVISLRGDRFAEINTLTNGNRRVELVFLNLPMHTGRRWMALPSLWRDRDVGVYTVVAKDSPLRKTVSYDHKALTQVLVGLMEQYRPTVIQTLDPDPDIQHSDERTRVQDSEQPGYSDHGDHTAVACFSWAAMVSWVAEATAQGGRVPGFTVQAFRGYYNRHWPKNLPPKALRDKARALAPYGGDPDWNCGNASGCGDYGVSGKRPLTNRKGWVRSTHHRYQGAQPVLAVGRDKRLAAYGVLGLRAVRWRETRPGSGRWGTAEDLGGGPLAPALGSAALKDGRQLLFGLRFSALGGRGAANRREIVLLEERSPGRGFLAWQGLGNPEYNDDRGRRIGVPVAVTAPDGRVHLFVRNADKRISTRVRDLDGRWSAWRLLIGEEVQDGLSAVVDKAGLVHVFGAGRSTVHHWRQEAPGKEVTFRTVVPDPKGGVGGFPVPAGPVAALPDGDGIKLYYRKPASGGLVTVDTALTSVKSDSAMREAEFEGYGPVSVAAGAGGPVILERQPNGRVGWRSTRVGQSRQEDSKTLGFPSLLVTAKGMAVAGLSVDGQPWLWLPDLSQAESRPVRRV
ncbi:PIG-L family deacetylase [Streptomyces albipurpureus]|uniref:PIG-L family deacetylase n=1 Tax=Streptomyces albipurpureus TaxID=2897419 RepID=A0ABT0UWZ6_9ACTN|nr:PIG-L family deacetylase [Streptomyces sp. CWNU-1]MCM2393108.1 PIG-L family deacetylase [Streptomyces sp. CWNU-1]